jgi:hypothetical protein
MQWSPFEHREQERVEVAVQGLRLHK